ncbi:MAG: MFS transporter [Opitutaceae bacterium]
MSTGPAISTPWWRTLTREHWFVFIVASLAWLFDCLDSQLFNLARDGAMESLLADKKQATVLAPYTTSWFLLGWAVGGLIFGALGDRFGRARILTFTILLYSLSTGFNALARSFESFCVYRFITGLGVGGVFGLAVALVADSVPDKARAPALGLLQSLSALGNISAGLIGMGIGGLSARQALPFGLEPWQALFVIGAVPALLCVVVMAKLKEPEKWTRARAEGAIRGIKFGSYSALLLHPRWRKNAWLALGACSAGIIGLWGIGNFHPKIVGSIVEAAAAAQQLTGDALASHKTYWRSAGLLLQVTGGFFGMFALAKLAQVKGRRIAFALALLLSFLTTVLVFKFMRTATDMYWMLPLMGFGQYSVFGVYAVYLPELFPTSLRSTGTSFCYNGGRIVAATAPFTISRITASLGGDVEGFRTAGAWVSGVLLLGILALPFLPETKDQPLPED